MWEETFKSHSDSKPYGVCVCVCVCVCACICVQVQCICIFTGILFYCVLRTQFHWNGYLVPWCGTCVWNSGACWFTCAKAYKVSVTSSLLMTQSLHHLVYLVVESLTVSTTWMCLNTSWTTAWLSMAPFHWCWPTSEQLPDTLSMLSLSIFLAILSALFFSFLLCCC